VGVKAALHGGPGGPDWHEISDRTFVSNWRMLAGKINGGQRG